MSEVEGAAVGGERIVLTQRGAPSAYLGISLKNGLLNLVTLTLYRFWGKTEVRRRLWSTTYLNGEAFEYTGLGKELFLGFLLAVGLIVLPFLVVMFGVQFLGREFISVIVILFYLFLGLLGGFGRFTAFRYLASRTAWRGIRFRLRGSPWKFAWTFLGYMFLSGLSLGWFWPAADRRLAGMLWGGLSFGDHPLEFRIEAARKEKVYGAFALAWIIGIVGYAIAVSAMIAVVKPATGGTPSVPTLAEIARIYVIFGVLVLLYPAVLAPFHAAMLRSIAAGIGFGEARFKLRLKWLELAVLMITNLLLAVVTLGFLRPFIEARTRKFLIDRLESLGAVDLSAVGQATDIRPRTGEGLADAFGIATV